MSFSGPNFSSSEVVGVLAGLCGVHDGSGAHNYFECGRDGLLAEA